MGQTGEWEEYSKWLVIAYLDRAKAEEHLLRATERAKEIRDHKPKQGYDWFNLGNQYDPEMEMGCNGTTYFIEEIALDTTVQDKSTTTPREGGLNCVLKRVEIMNGCLTTEALRSQRNDLLFSFSIRCQKEKSPHLWCVGFPQIDIIL